MDIDQRDAGKYDAIRGAAAMAVFLAHTCDILILRVVPPDGPLDIFPTILARHSVLVFFLLSGFLITSSIQQNITRGGEFDFYSYSISRIARIYPPLIGMVGIVLFIWFAIYAFNFPGLEGYDLDANFYAMREKFDISFSDVPAALLMGDGLRGVNGALWSLYIEWKIYFIAAGVACILSSSSRLIIIAGGTLALATSIIGYHEHFQFLLYVGVWGLGASFKLMDRATLARWWRPVTVICAGLLGLALLRNFRLLFMPGRESELVQFLCCILYSYFIFTMRWPELPVMSRLGKLSYSLYIIHFPILLFTLSLSEKWTQRSVGKAALVSAVVIPIIGVIADQFARRLERPKFFKPKLAAVFGAVTRR